MALLSVDLEKCIRCGACEEVCPSHLLMVRKNGPREIPNAQEACIACGHCVAVCPSQALDNSKSPLKEMQKIDAFPVLDEKKAEEFLRSRRAIRAYKDEKVPKEKLEKLLKLATCAPTGSNSQGLSFKVISKEETIKKIVELVVDWMREMGEQNSGNGFYDADVYKGLARFYDKTKHDIILRGAKHLILAYASQEMKERRARDNACFMLSYAELFAPSLGIGTCWAGFFEWAINDSYKPLLDYLAIAEDKQFAGAIMVGVPKYTYKLIPNRDPLKAEWD